MNIRKKAVLFWLYLIIVSGSLFAQDQMSINVVTQVVPPFGTDLMNYSNNTKVFLQSPVFNGNVSLFLHIKGDNGVDIQTSDDYYPNDISLTTANPVSPVDLGGYFDPSNLKSSGVPIDQLMTEGLPEGTYQICFAVRSADLSVISPAEPTGCSNMFNVVFNEPPIPINPLCGDTLKIPSQSLVFSWSPAAGAPPFTEYTLRIVEILDPEQDPADAMLSSTEPVFFESTTFGALSFLYGPNQPILEGGRKYAWQVISRDGETYTQFKNEGRSEVCWFVWEPSNLISGSLTNNLDFEILSPSSGSDELTVTKQQDLYIAWGWLNNGNFFKADSLPSSFVEKDIQSYRLSIHPGKQKRGRETDQGFKYQTVITLSNNVQGMTVSNFQRSVGELEQIGLKNDHWYSFEVEALNSSNAIAATASTKDIHLLMSNEDTVNTAHISGQLHYRFDNSPGDYPVPNTSLRFYLSENLKIKSAVTASKTATDIQLLHPDYYAKTDAEGNFELDIPLPSAQAKNASYRMEIVSPYYQPVDSIINIADSTKTLQIGQIIAVAYNYSLKLYVKKAFGSYKVIQDHSYYNMKGQLIEKIDTVIIGTPDTSIQEIPAGIPVILYRKQKPSYLPPVEGQYSKNTKTNGIIKIAEGTTALETEAGGKQVSYINFDRLLCNVYNNDIYYLKALQPDKSDNAYKNGSFVAPEEEFRFVKSNSSGDSTHFDIERTYNIISKDPPKSTISGQLVYSWPGDNTNVLRPLAYEDFSIVVEYLYNNKPVKFMELMVNGAYKTDLQLDGDPNTLNTGDYGQVMASGTTDGNGRFSIQAVNLNQKGSLGTGTATTTGGTNPFPTEVIDGIPNPKEAIINPWNQSIITVIDQISGFESGGIFNFSDMSNSFGAIQQSNQLNGTMNSGLGMGANAQQKRLTMLQNNNGQDYGLPQHSWLTSVAHIHGPNNGGFEEQDLSNASKGITIQRVYRIRVKDQDFYYNPEKNIIVDPLKSTDAGPIEVKVKEIKWKFTAKNKDKDPEQLLEGLQAVVFRDPSDKVSNLPQGEGDGQYQVKQLINPKFSGDVTNTAQKPSQGKSGQDSGQASGKSQPAGTTQGTSSVAESHWQLNLDSYTFNGLSTSQLLNSSQSWPEGSYEWLDNSGTNSSGEVSFDRLVGGFKDYYLEMVSDPSKASYFYQPSFLSMDATQYSVHYEQKDDKGKEITTNNNCDYGNYWDTRQTDVPVAVVEVAMKPQHSRMGGRVLDKSSRQGIKKAFVLLTDEKENCISFQLADSAGYFEFLNVLDLAKLPNNVDNLTARVRAASPGYTQQEEQNNQDYKILTVQRDGGQAVTEILMVPSATITGKIKNEDGKPVDAYIKRIDGLVVETEEFKSGFMVLIDNIGKFVLPVHVKAGETTHFYVIPKDPGYFTDTVEVKNIKKGINDIGVHTVYRRKHRLLIHVIDNSNTGINIADAQIKINKNQTINTNSNGEAELSFENISVNSYTLSITGPKGKGYIPQVINLKNEETKTVQSYLVRLKKGGSVSGLVTLDGNPVAGAKVYLDYKEQSSSQFIGSFQLNPNALNQGESQSSPPTEAKKLTSGSLPQLITYTDKSGQYQLDGLPVNSGQITLIATLDTTFTVIGDKKNVSISGGQATKDLALKTYGEMVIKSIYGFPLSVESITETSDKNVVNVSGIVNFPESTSPFAWISNEQVLRIHNVPFKKKVVSGKSLGVPENDNTSLDAVSTLKMQYKNKYNIQISNKAGSDNNSPTGELTIRKRSNNRGELAGYAHIVDNSFNYPSSYLNFKDKDQFYLGLVNNNKINNELGIFSSLSTDESGATQSKPYEEALMQPFFHLSNKLGTDIHFNFIQFDATADPKNSYIDQEGKIHLDVSMECHIPNAQPEYLTVHAGDIVLDENKVYPASGAKPLVVKMEKWNLEVSDWTIDTEKGGIYSTKGLLKTGKVDVPFTEFNLRSDLFVMQGFQVTNLKLGGGVKLLSDISLGNALMVYDTKCGSDMSGHWKLTVAGSGDNPAARIKNLNPFLDHDINIQYIQLLSNNEDIFSIQQGSPLKINNNGVAQFSPQTISSGSNFFTLTGSLSIPAPRLIPVMASLMFKGSPASLKMDIKPLPMSFEGQGHVNFTSDKALIPIIRTDQIIIKGQVEEENGFSPIDATFYADGSTPSAASYHVDIAKDFVLDLTSGSSSASSQEAYNLKIDHGGMRVSKVANDWDLFSFTGNLLTGDKTMAADGGKQNNKMTFTVHGKVAVTGDAIKVSNIDSPFGTMQLEYDFPERALHGSLEVNDQKIGPFMAAGSIDMLIDPKGWYFLGACKVNTGLPGPFSSMNMGFLLGNRGYTGAEATIVIDKVSQFSYSKSSLCWLKSDGATEIHGLFITAGKSIIDTELGVNLGVASIYLRAMAGGEASFYSDFKDWSIALSAGLYGKVEAGASALNISINGSASLDGSITGMVSANEFCVGGKIGANVSGSGKVDFAVKSISFDFSEHAVVELTFSTVKGIDTGFYFGTAPPPTCNSENTCGN